MNLSAVKKTCEQFSHFALAKTPSALRFEVKISVFRSARNFRDYRFRFSCKSPCTMEKDAQRWWGRMLTKDPCSRKIEQVPPPPRARNMGPSPATSLRDRTQTEQRSPSRRHTCHTQPNTTTRSRVGRGLRRQLRPTEEGLQLERAGLDRLEEVAVGVGRRLQLLERRGEGSAALDR